MKKTIALGLVGATLMTLNLVACGADQAKKAKEASDKTTHLATGLDKPLSTTSAKSLETSTNGLYRLTELRMQADFDIKALGNKEATRLSMAARQVFSKKRPMTSKFDVDLIKLEKSVLNSNSKRDDIDMTLPISVKVPLTIRVNQGQVSFEQLRLYWLCVKNVGKCDRENYLSTSATAQTLLIDPAKYLVTKGLSSRTPDLSTQIQSMITTVKDSKLMVEFASALDDDHEVLVRLTFERDLKEYDEDRRNNSDEEVLRTSEPSP